MDTQLLSAIIISAVGLLITLLYYIHSMNLQHDKMLKELFTEFNRRYDSLNNDLHKLDEMCRTNKSISIKDVSFELKQKVIDYFNLCAEEYFWYKRKKRIDKELWQSWNRGMNYWYSNPIIKSMWAEEVEANGRLAYYLTNKDGFFDE